MADMIQHYKNLKDPDEPEKPDNGCWNCMNFDWKHRVCTQNWNNMDYCEAWEEDPDADPECLNHGGNEP
jgi:hypothetical protein